MQESSLCSVRTFPKRNLHFHPLHIKTKDVLQLWIKLRLRLKLQVRVCACFSLANTYIFLLAKLLLKKFLC